MKHRQPATHDAQKVAPKMKTSHPSANGQRLVDSAVHTIEQGREALIRQTAYTLYQARNCVNGHDLDDWLRAEEQVIRARAPNGRASSADHAT